jgi:hypothetical protein
MATKNKNKNRKVDGRPLRDVLPDDLHLDFFSDTIIEKNDMNDTMALMKNVSIFNVDLDKVPSWWNIQSVFSIFSRKASEPSPAMLQIEAAKSTGELIDVFDTISYRKYSNVQLLTHVQMAQLTQMFSRFRHVQEGLTMERNMITFEKRNVSKEKKLKYSHHAYQDTYDELLQYSTAMQEKKYSKPSLRGVATDVYLQISGVFKGIYFLAADSTSRSFWVPMLVTSVLVPYAGLLAGYTTAAIVGINFIFNLSPAYVKYMDRRKYDEDTSTVMAICKVIAEASKQTFFVSALQYVPGLIFAEGYVTIGSIFLPVIGRLVMNDEYKQANIKAAMESNKGTEEMKLRQETLGKNPDLQNFFCRYDEKAVGNFARILANLEYGVNFSKNVFFSLPVLGHIVLYQNFAVYTLTVDVVNLVWNHSFDPISWFLHWAENLYDDKNPTGDDSRNSNVATIGSAQQEDSKVKQICKYCGIAFKTAFSVGKKIYDTIKAITSTTASGVVGIVKVVALPAVLALLGIFFSDAINAIPPKTLAYCLGILPSWMGWMLSNIRDGTCWVVVLIMKALGIHGAAKYVWDGVKKYVLCHTEQIYVYLFKTFPEKAQNFDKDCLGGWVSNLLADIYNKFPSLDLNTVEQAIEVFQNCRNEIFARTELNLVNLLGNPNTVKLATRITNLGLSMGFFSAMIVGMTKAPEFLYRTYEKIVLTNIRVIGLSVVVVGATALILAATGAVSLAAINPLAILALAIGFIRTNYLDLVPGASSEIAELCKNYIVYIVSSENFFTFIKNSANSQATSFIMMAIRSNLSKYIAVYLPFIGSMLWQDFTGNRLAAWQTLAFSLATGIATYTGLRIIGSTRLGLKLKQCVDAIQSISVASISQETNFLFKWYIKDTDILETSFSDMFKYLFVEVYTRQKIDVLVRNFSSEYVFAKTEVQEKLTDEEIATVIEEDYKSTADYVKKLQSQIADIEKTRIEQIEKLRDILKELPDSERKDPLVGLWGNAMRTLWPMTRGMYGEWQSNKPEWNNQWYESIRPLHNVNPEYYMENCDPVIREIDESTLIMDVALSKINIANESHLKFKELVQRNVVDKLTVYANGLCNEMAFWRKTSPDINTNRVEVAERYAQKIREKYELMAVTMGPLFSQVEDVLDSTNKLSDDVRKIMKSETDGGVPMLYKTEEIVKINFVQRNIEIGQLTKNIKKSITINEPLNVLDRKLTLLQNQVKDILIADASETSTFDELSKTKKILEECNDFTGSLVEKMKLVLDVCKQDMDITRQNVFSIAHVSFDANGILEKDNFYRDVVAPLKEAEKLVVEELILESAAKLDKADMYVSNALDIISNEDREFRINIDTELDEEFENAQDFSLSTVFKRLYKLGKDSESDYRLVGFNDETDVKLFKEKRQGRRSDRFIGKIPESDYRLVGFNDKTELKLFNEKIEKIQNEKDDRLNRDVISQTKQGQTVIGNLESFQTPNKLQSQLDRASDRLNKDVISRNKQGQTVIGNLESFQTPNRLQSQLDRASDRLNKDVISRNKQGQTVIGNLESFQTPNRLQSQLDRASDKFIGDVVSPIKLSQSIEGKTNSFKTTAGQFDNLKDIEKLDVVSIVSPGMMHGTKVSGKLENDVITPQQNYKPGGISSYILSSPNLQKASLPQKNQVQNEPPPILSSPQLVRKEETIVAPVKDVKTPQQNNMLDRLFAYVTSTPNLQKASIPQQNQVQNKPPTIPSSPQIVRDEETIVAPVQDVKTPQQNNKLGGFFSFSPSAPKLQIASQSQETQDRNYRPGGIFSFIQSTRKLQIAPKSRENQVQNKPQPITPPPQLVREEETIVAPVQDNDKFRRDVIARTERPRTFLGENLSFISPGRNSYGNYLSDQQPVVNSLGVGQQRGTIIEGSPGKNGIPGKPNLKDRVIENPNWKDRVTEDYFRFVVDETKKNYDGLNVETRNFLQEIGYTTDAEMRAVVKDFGNVINLDERKAMSILDFTIEQKIKLREWEQNILKTAKMGINIAPKKENPRILQPDVDSLVNLKNTMDDEGTSETPYKPKRGILTPVLEKRRAVKPPGVPYTNLEPRESPVSRNDLGGSFFASPSETIASPSGNIAQPSENRLIALAREATKKFSMSSRNQKNEISSGNLGAKSSSIDTSIKSQTKIDITIETKIESTIESTVDTKTSTAFGTPDDSPNVKEGRESVFRRKDTGIKQRPEGAPEPLKEGLLSFNNKNGLFLKSRVSNWFRQRNTIVSELMKKGDQGVQSIPAFKKIYEKWNDVITSIAGQNDIISDNINYVKKNYTLMSYSEEFSKELEKIEITPEVLSTIFPRKEQRENIRQALDAITSITKKPATFANPLFLWAISEKRAPPHVSNADDPLENVRNQLLVRSELIIAKETTDLRNKLEEQYSVFNENMDVVLNDKSRRMVNKKLYPSPHSLDIVRNLLRDSYSWVISKSRDFGDKVDEIGNIGYALTKPFRNVLYSRLVYGTEPGSADYLKILDRSEKFTHLLEEDLDKKFLLLPKSLQNEGNLKKEYDNCKRLTFKFNQKTERIRDVEYTVPYGAIAGDGLVGTIAKKADYQDIDNRYLPKERWVMLDNFQYKSAVMEALFVTGENLKINPEYEKDLLAISTTLKFDSLQKLKVDHQNE